MKHQHSTKVGNLLDASVNLSTGYMGRWNRTKAPAAILKCFWMAVGILIGFAAALPAGAQVVAINDLSTNNVERVRVTVPVNYSGVVVLTNLVRVYTNYAPFGIDDLYHIDPVNVAVTNLPAGASYILTDTNNVETTTLPGRTNNGSTFVFINLALTNVAQGTYTFYLTVTNATGTNDVPANKFPFVLQVAHIWNGSGSVEASFNVSNNWANASSWQGGVPGPNDDVVFGDVGAQTNNAFSTGIAFTNASIDTNMAIASLRFAQSTYVSPTTTNSLYHTIRIAPSASLMITGTNGFSILRDYMDELADPGIDGRTFAVNFSGGGALIVSNANANFSILVGSVGSSGLQPTLNMSNLNIFVSYVNRMGLSEYQLYPNYRELNNAYNAANDTNGYSGRPARFAANVYFAAKTNFITALYSDPDNYTNEFTRGYGVTYMDSEQFGIGSGGAGTFFLLGVTNKINADGVCFVRASSATGNTGNFGFAAANSGAVFRNTAGGSSRMSVFTVADDGGTTNQAQGNVKATVSFMANNGVVDILADRLYIARDRTMITSNGSPNVSGDLFIGKGIVDVNTAILGFQEHSNKMDWANAANGGFQAYLNFCQGKLWVTNGGTVRINNTLTLGYTADRNPVDSAQQYNTYGQVTVFTNSTVTVSNIICDGGLNFYDTHHRQNTITLTQGTLVVSNTIGGPAGALAGDAGGLPLDTLTMDSGTLTLFVVPGKTNVFVRNLVCLGTTPSTIKIASLVTNGLSYPTNIPVISYETASAFLSANLSAVGGGIQGYILNNLANHTIDLYITTNAPKTLVWTGNHSSDWDYTTPNWVPVGGGPETTFTLGDAAIFDDTSSVNNINMAASIVPNQTITGVTITNTTKNYTFSTSVGGNLAGTFSMVKQGTGNVTMNVEEQGPITISAGNLDGNSNGKLGSTTIATNVAVNFSGNINGNLTSSGTVTFGGGSINGSVSILGGWFVNSGTVNCGLTGTITVTNSLSASSGPVVTNNGTINLGNVNSTMWDGCTMANFGTIHTAGINNAARLLVRGLYYGTGNFIDDAGGLIGTSGRLNMTGNGTTSLGINAEISPGVTPNNSIGSINVQARLDLHESNPQNTAGKLLIEVDQAGSTNDIVYADKWNNIGCIIVMTNLNGSFASGQQFRVFRNNNGDSYPNYVDTAGIYPLMSPAIPGPGLQWNLSAIQVWGTIMVTNSTMVWDGVNSTSWDTNGVNTSWKNGVFTNSMGAIFDDTASGSTIVTLNTPVAPAGINVVTNTAGPANSFITNTPAFMPGIIVSNAVKDYTFVGNNKITGMTGIYKTGPGTLSLLMIGAPGTGNTNNNDFTGGVIIDGGTLALTNTIVVGTDPTGQKPAYDQWIIDNATVKFYGTTNQSLTRLMTINQNGATFEVSSNSTILTLGANILGPGALTKTGPGTLWLSQSGNAYLNTFVNVGTLRLMGATAGYGTISIASGATLEVTNSGSANNVTLTNVIDAGSASVPINLVGPTALRYDGQLAGSGTVTIACSNQFSFNGALTNFSGTLSFGNSPGHFQFNTSSNSNPCQGSPFATFNLGTSSATLSNLNGAGITYDLGALAGGPNTILAGRLTNNIATNATSIYRIGANGSSTTFSGKITDGFDASSTVSVVKVGSGALLLNGVNTFTGGTTVSNGVLGGTGSLASALTVEPGATLSPGASTGTFTVNSSATLGGTVLMELNEASSPVNDELVVSGTITATGALVVTNVGPDLYNHTTFKLFNKAVTGFAPVTLPAMDPSNTKTYTWDNNLSVDGSITLLSGGSINPNPPTISVSNNVSSGMLTLSWQVDRIGWHLQAQTNSLSTGLIGNWVDVTGADVTNVVNIPVDSVNATVFYRMFLIP